MNRPNTLLGRECRVLRYVPRKQHLRDAIEAWWLLLLLLLLLLRLLLILLSYLHPATRFVAAGQHLHSNSS
jgi:hypothetical protein